jgi:hypothetical protein
VASNFTLQGSYTANPGSGSPSADPQITAPINEGMVLANEVVSQLTLSVDGPVNLPLCGLDAANLLVLKCVGGKITVRLTSADGSAQAFPVDSFLALTSASTDITAITVERIPATSTVVKYFLGQKA